MKSVIKAVIAVVVLAGFAAAQEFGTIDISKAGGVPAASASVVPINQMGSQALLDLLMGLKLPGCEMYGLITSKNEVELSVKRTRTQAEHTAVLMPFKPGDAMVYEDTAGGISYMWNKTEKVTKDVLTSFSLSIATDKNSGRIVRVFAKGVMTNLAANVMVDSTVECGKTSR